MSEVTLMSDNGPAQLGGRSERVPGLIAGNPRERISQSAARVAQRALKASVFLNFGQTVVIVILGVLLLKLFPLVRYYPVALAMQDKQFVDVQPVFEGSTAARWAKEAFVREYIMRRETLNLIDDVKRYKWVKKHSEPKLVWDPFYKVMYHDKAYEAAKQRNEAWVTKIKTAYPLEDGNDDKWAVEFTKERLQNNRRVAPPEGWLATVELGRLGGVTSDREELRKNPLRLAVRQFKAHEKAFIESGRVQ